MHLPRWGPTALSRAGAAIERRAPAPVRVRAELHVRSLPQEVRVDGVAQRLADSAASRADAAIERRAPVPVRVRTEPHVRPRSCER